MSWPPSAAPDPRESAAQHGLTLVELLVVLFILALLAQTAVLATEGALEQGQRDATVRTLEDLEAAVLGDAGRVDPIGQPLVSGFVADVGRLPIRSSDDAVDPLHELFLRPPAVTAFGIQAPKGDREVRIAAGWRGPYLRLGIGLDRAVDGWAQPFVALDPAGQPLTTPSAVAGVVSFGADRNPGGTGFATDLDVRFHDLSAVIRRDVGDVPIRVRSRSTTDTSVVVRIYGPREGLVQTLDQQVLALTADSDAVWTFPAVPIGTRVLRAYVYTDGTPDPDDDLPAALRSRVRPILVEPGGIPEVLLEIDA